PSCHSHDELLATDKKALLKARTVFAPGGTMTVFFDVLGKEFPYTYPKGKAQAWQSGKYVGLYCDVQKIVVGEDVFMAYFEDLKAGPSVAESCRAWHDSELAEDTSVFGKADAKLNSLAFE